MFLRVVLALSRSIFLCLNDSQQAAEQTLTLPSNGPSIIIAAVCRVWASKWKNVVFDLVCFECQGHVLRIILSDTDVCFHEVSISNTAIFKCCQ